MTLIDLLLFIFICRSNSSSSCSIFELLLLSSLSESSSLCMGKINVAASDKYRFSSLISTPLFLISFISSTNAKDQPRHHSRLLISYFLVFQGNNLNLYTLPSITKVCPIMPTLISTTSASLESQSTIFPFLVSHSSNFTTFSSKFLFKSIELR